MHGECRQADRPDREWHKLNLNFTREYVEAVIQSVKGALAQPPPLVGQPTFCDEDKQSLAAALKSHHDAHKRKVQETAASGDTADRSVMATVITQCLTQLGWWPADCRSSLCSCSMHAGCHSHVPTQAARTVPCSDAHLRHSPAHWSAFAMPCTWPSWSLGQYQMGGITP